MRMPTLEQFRSSRNVLFWSLHAAGWAAYGLTQYFGALLYEKPSSYARVIAVSAVAGFVLSMPMRYIYRRLWSQPPACSDQKTRLRLERSCESVSMIGVFPQGRIILRKNSQGKSA